MATAVLAYIPKHKDFLLKIICPKKKRNYFTIKSLLLRLTNNFRLNTNRKKRKKLPRNLKVKNPSMQSCPGLRACGISKEEDHFNGIKLPGASSQSESIKGERQWSTHHLAETHKLGRMWGNISVGCFIKVITTNFKGSKIQFLILKY